MTDLSTIREALAAASPGPWVMHSDDMEVVVVMAEDDRWPRSYCPIARGMDQGESDGEADGNLIANAPTWLAELVDRVEAAESATEWDQGVDALRHEVLSEELGHYMRENVRMYEALKDFADNGLRADLNPTTDGSSTEAAITHLYGYIRRLDQSVRGRAESALEVQA